MKKRTMAVGGLLLAVAMTGYSVAGTYAKYVSTIDYTDEARVAKWELTDNTVRTDVDSLFKQSYSLKNMEGNDYTYVKSLDTDKVVAPGTNGTYSFEVYGVMETNYTLDFKLNNLVNNAVLTDADLFDNTTLNYKKELLNADGTDLRDDVKAALESDGITGYTYNPVRYKITYTTVADTMGIPKESDWVTFEELEDTLNTLIANNNTINGKYVYGPMNYQNTGTPILDSPLFTVKIDWMWAFDEIDATISSTLNSTVPTNDALDTLLGNKAAKGENTDVSFNLAITAEQTQAEEGTYTN